MAIGNIIFEVHNTEDWEDLRHELARDGDHFGVQLVQAILDKRSGARPEKVMLSLQKAERIYKRQCGHHV